MPAPRAVAPARGGVPQLLAATGQTHQKIVPAPPHPCVTLTRILTYDYNWRDTIFNSVCLLLVLASLIAATASGALTLGAFFWVPVALLIASLQIIAAALTQQQGFSLIWCMLAGFIVYEELRHSVFSHSLATGVLALVSGGTCGCALLYYLVEELCWEKWEYAAGELRGWQLALTAAWFRLGTTAVHLVFVGLGTAVGAAADAAPARAPAFWAILALGAAAALAVPVVVCHARRLRGCTLSSVHPQPPRPLAHQASQEELAIANLEAQLMRTRDEIAWLRSDEGRAAELRRAAGSESGGDGGDAGGASGDGGGDGGGAGGAGGGAGDAGGDAGGAGGSGSGSGSSGGGGGSSGGRNCGGDGGSSASGSSASGSSGDGRGDDSGRSHPASPNMSPKFDSADTVERRLETKLDGLFRREATLTERIVTRLASCESLQTGQDTSSSAGDASPGASPSAPASHATSRSPNTFSPLRRLQMQTRSAERSPGSRSVLSA